MEQHESRVRMNKLKASLALASAALVLTGCVAVMNHPTENLPNTEPSITTAAKPTTELPQDNTPADTNPADDGKSDPVIKAPSVSSPEFMYSGDSHQAKIIGVYITSKAEHRIEIDLFCNASNKDSPIAGYEYFYDGQLQSSAPDTLLNTTIGYDPCTEDGEVSKKVANNPGFYGTRLVGSVATANKVTNPIKDWVSDVLR